MTASELRIGNMVYLGIVNEPIIITKIDPNSVNIEMAEPISLTEEWLLNFGAEKDRGAYRIKKLKGYLCLLNLKGDLFYEYNVGMVQMCKIKYVHQLQNLYFALTGEELTIKKATE